MVSETARHQATNSAPARHATSWATGTAGQTDGGPGDSGLRSAATPQRSPIAAAASALGYGLGIVAHWLLSSRAVFSDVVLTTGEEAGEFLGRELAAPAVGGGETVMRLLQRNAKVATRFGGGFVQSIDGLAGGRGGRAVRGLGRRGRRLVRDTPLVMAGTSAGAAAMSTSMIVRGEPSSHPHKNAVKLSPGLGFVKNIIIDQHFSERGRISRLITAVSYNPYNLGIGIDENTAIILDGHGILEVYGQGSATIVDGSQISFNEIAEVGDNESFSICGVLFHVLRDGLVYNFLERHPIQPTTEFLLPDLG